MDLLRNVDLGQTALIAVSLCGLVVVGLFLLQFIGLGFDLIGSVFGIFFDILGGGPLSGCGCIVGLLGCGACACLIAFAVSVISTCGTPRAVQFCELFGR